MSKASSSKQSSMASSSSTLRSSYPHSIHCHHDFKAKIRIVRKGPNLGHRFFGCSNWPNDDCSFFEWKKECGYTQEGDLQLKLTEREQMVKELDTALLKKQQYKAEIKNLNLELKKAAVRVREKNLFVILCTSWAVFVLYIALCKN
ncbi:unnamed protein product [Amaranthus hypochondriacus]